MLEGPYWLKAYRAQREGIKTLERRGYTYQRVVFPSLGGGAGMAVGSPGAGPWKAAVGSAWPVIAGSAAATGAAATSAAGC